MEIPGERTPIEQRAFRILGLGNLDAPAAAAAENGILRGTVGAAVFVGDILRAQGIPDSVKYLV